MAKEIGEILDGRTQPAEPKEVAPDKVEAQVKTEPEAKPEAKQAKETPKPAKASEADGDEAITKEVDPAKRAAGFEGAYKSEKTKRKEREAEAERWKAEADKLRKDAEDRDKWWKSRVDLLQQPQRQTEPQKPRPSLFENPEQWEEANRADTQAAISGIRFQYSEEFARLKYGEKFDAAARAAEEAIGVNPHHPLIRVLRESGNPGEGLVQWYLKESVFKETGGDLEGFRKKTLEEMLADPKTREEILSKLNLKSNDGQDQQQPQTPAPQELPTNLAGARSTSGRTNPVWTGPKPLDELIPSSTRKR